MTPDHYLLFNAGFVAFAFGVNWLHNRIIAHKVARLRDSTD